MKAKDLISIHDLSLAEIKEIFDLAGVLKSEDHQPLLAGKTLALIFEKPSTRTRVSFEVGMFQLGGNTVHLSPQAIQIGKRESVADVARTLSRYVDGIMIRTFHHQDVIDLAKYATVPVINGLSDLSHPCQGLTDLYTIQEKKSLEGLSGLKGLKLAYIGDGNNVCHSLMFACAKLGVNMSVAAPAGYEPKKEVAALVFADAKTSGSEIVITHDPVAAVKGADVIYTDVWASMGQEAEKSKRSQDFKPFQVNSHLVDLAEDDTIVMHCLPAHRGEEITGDVLDGPRSVVFDQAENRLHVQKAILALLLGGKNG